MLFDALDSKGQNSIRWQMFCCFESSSIVNKTDFICQIVLGSGFVLLFYALDYSSFQDQDVVLVDSHLNQMILSFAYLHDGDFNGDFRVQIAMVSSIGVISWKMKIRMDMKI